MNNIITYLAPNGELRQHEFIPKPPSLEDFDKLDRPDPPEPSKQAEKMQMEQSSAPEDNSPAPEEESPAPEEEEDASDEAFFRDRERRSKELHEEAAKRGSRVHLAKGEKPTKEMVAMILAEAEVHAKEREEWAKKEIKREEKRRSDKDYDEQIKKLG